MFILPDLVILKLPLWFSNFVTIFYIATRFELWLFYQKNKAKQNITKQNQTQTHVPKQIFFLQSVKSLEVLDNSVLLQKMWRKILQKRWKGKTYP